MSIMDLNLTRRKSGHNLVAAAAAAGLTSSSQAVPIGSQTSSSAAGQSYELIKSTQVRNNEP